MNKVIGIGEYAFSNNEEDTIKTFALASCVAVIVYCPKNKVLGMAHIAMPDSGLRSIRQAKKPAYFADEAVPLLFHVACRDYKCSMEGLMVHLLGGANSTKSRDTFNIGERNVNAITEILGKMGVKDFDMTETGGCNCRTVEVDVATGSVKISKNPMRL